MARNAQRKKLFRRIKQGEVAHAFPIVARIEARHEKRLDHAKRTFHAIHELPLDRIVGDVALGRIDHLARKQNIIVVTLLP